MAEKKTSTQVEEILKASYAQEQEVLDMLKDVRKQLNEANSPRKNGPYRAGKDYPQWTRLSNEQ